MTPEEVLKAAEGVRRIVEAHEYDPYSDPRVIDILKRVPRGPLSPSPPLTEPPPPRTTACPNFPNPCYCTGACMRLGAYPQRPQRPRIYC